MPDRLPVRARAAARLAVPLGALVLLGATEACLVFRSVRYEAVPLGGVQVVESAVKAHLLDGSTILFPDGVTIGSGQVQGIGTRYGLTLERSGMVAGVPLDSVLAMESFRNQHDVGKSFVFSTLATAAVIGGAIAIACAADPKCFGSCPTVYSDSAGVPTLEAEGFSYSVAPIFESRDVDRLRAAPDESGAVRLEIRNEAFETHYLNHLELIEVWHASGQFVAPDPGGRPVALGGSLKLARAIDRDGRDLRGVLSEHDGEVFSSSPERLHAAASSSPDGDGLEDHIELDVEVPAGTESVGLRLRMRNSLLATVLFYDLMLGDRGPRALDWLARDLDQIGPAVELGRWAAETLGMRITVRSRDGWTQVARVGDTGPVAWNDIAVVLPVPDAGPAARTMSIRLSFPADGWRIDQVAAFNEARYPESRVTPLAAVEGPDGSLEDEALENLLTPDERYLVTNPGERFYAIFRPGGTGDASGLATDREAIRKGEAGAASARTFFLASQGYYIEWIRQRWLAEGRQTTAFKPGPDALVEALRRWGASQESMERLFYATKVPVR